MVNYSLQMHKILGSRVALGRNKSHPRDSCIIEHDIALIALIVLENNVQDMISVEHILLIVECGIISRSCESEVISVQNEPIYRREV